LSISLTHPQTHTRTGHGSEEQIQDLQFANDDRGKKTCNTIEPVAIITTASKKVKKLIRKSN
jgi:hypothetical protein